MVSLYRLLPRETISIRGLNETSFHLAKLTCALLLFASSWMSSMPPVPAWTLCIGGYAILTASVAALVAEADWEPRVNFALGLVVLAAPWVLGFAHDAVPMLVHVSGGAIITLLSGIELWMAREGPPWRFGPGAARRADLVAEPMAIPILAARPVAPYLIAPHPEARRATARGTGPPSHSEREAGQPDHHTGISGFHIR